MLIPSRTQALGRSPSQDLRKKCIYHLNTLVSNKRMAPLGGRRPLVIDILVPDFDFILMPPVYKKFWRLVWKFSLLLSTHHTNMYNTTTPHPPSWPSCWRSCPSCSSATSFPASSRLSRKPISFYFYPQYPLSSNTNLINRITFDE